jgi:hypothetical protein
MGRASGEPHHSLQEHDMHALPHRLVALAGAALAGVAIASAPLAAQSGRPTFGVAAGATFPIGDFGDLYKSGYSIGAHLGVRPATSPLGFRLEGTFNQHDYKPTNLGNVQLNVLGLIANVLAGAAGAADAVRPYAIGGVGVYNLRSKLAGETASSTKFGVNGGAGIDLPLSGIGVFLEARYHHVFSDTDDNDGFGFNAAFIPITVGIRF